MKRNITIQFNNKSYNVEQIFIDCFNWQSDEENGQRIEKVLPNLPKNMAKQLARFIRINPLHDSTPEYIKEKETEEFFLDLYNEEDKEYYMCVERHTLNPNTGYYFMGDSVAFFARENNYRMSFSSYNL